jgi:hypothetical protein
MPPSRLGCHLLGAREDAFILNVWVAPLPIDMPFDQVCVCIAHARGCELVREAIAVNNLASGEGTPTDENQH